METFKPFLGYFFPGKCYQRVLVELNFLDGVPRTHIYFAIVFWLFNHVATAFSSSFSPSSLVPCLKLLNSRILSSMVLLGALIGEEVSLLSLYAQFFSLLFVFPIFCSLLFVVLVLLLFPLLSPRLPSLSLLLHLFLLPPPLSQSSSDCQDLECQLS